MARKSMQGVMGLGIPNMLSILRLILIPVFVGMYLSDIRYSGIIAAAVLIASGITDVLDGFIARRFNMTSALGRILDPLADKLTQATICICLVIRRAAPLWILLLLIIKEFVMIGAGANIIRKGKEMMSSKWFGKLGTVVFYTVMIVIIAFRPSSHAIDVMMAVVLAFTFFALVMYVPFFFRIISKKSAKS